MSRFSGVFDLYDWFFTCRDYDIDFIKRSKIYIGHSFNMDTYEIIPGRQIHIENLSDLVPYYPYVVSSGAHDENGDTIYLCEKSYPDMLWDELGHKPLMYDCYKEELRKELEHEMISRGSQNNG